MDDREVVLITGASRGIGRGLAVRVAAGGRHVVAVARGVAGLDETVAACRAAGGTAEARPTDLAEPLASRALMAWLEARHGRLDVLINNAGAYHHGPMAETRAEVQDRLIGLNVAAPMRLIGQGIPILVRTASRHGRAVLINVASVAGLHGIADEAAYAASKHAVVGLGRSLFAELRGSDVAVSTLCPGLVATEMAEGRGARVEHALRSADVADAVDYILACRPGACPSEIVLQPQRDPLPPPGDGSGV